MLDALQFVKGTVIEKSVTPHLTHVRIADGRVTATDGTVTLSAPIALDLQALPRAAPFVKAVAKCKDEAAIYMTDKGRLGVRSGKFRAYIECLPEEHAQMFSQPEGNVSEIDASLPLLTVLRTMLPFIGKDASREWSRGVLLTGNSCFATNNIVLIEHWLGNTAFPVHVNLPEKAIKELLRINKPPTHIQTTANSATFHYADGAWLQTRLYDLQWPNVRAMLEAAPLSQPFTHTSALAEALRTVQELTEGLGAYIKDGVVNTSRQDGEGASYDVDELAGVELTVNIQQAAAVCDLAQQIDFSTYPKAMPWRGKTAYGGSVRGLLMGMR